MPGPGGTCLAPGLLELALGLSAREGRSAAGKATCLVWTGMCGRLPTPGTTSPRRMEKPQTDASPRGAHAHHPAVHLGSLRLPCCVSWQAAASPPGPVRPWSPGETTACCQRDVTRERDPTGTVASSLGIGGLQCGDADRDPALSACCAPGDTATASDNCSSVAATAS